MYSNANVWMLGLLTAACATSATSFVSCTSEGGIVREDRKGGNLYQGKGTPPVNLVVASTNSFPACILVHAGKQADTIANRAYTLTLHKV